MAIGPNVFGPNRVGLWAIENVGLPDKLKHVLPRARALVPNLTDVFLPLSATMSAKDVVRQNNMHAHLYGIAGSTPAAQLAASMLSVRRVLGTGAIEVDLEGAAVQPDKPALAAYAVAFVARVRQTNPNLDVRLNVPPFKGYALPVDMIKADPHLYVIAQAYYGNMDGRLSEADVLLDLLDYGLPADKVSIHYAVMANSPRTFCLPGAGYKPITKGSIYDDDLLIDSGRLPA